MSVCKTNSSNLYGFWKEKSKRKEVKYCWKCNKPIQISERTGYKTEVGPDGELVHKPGHKHNCVEKLTLGSL